MVKSAKTDACTSVRIGPIAVPLTASSVRAHAIANVARKRDDDAVSHAGAAMAKAFGDQKHIIKLKDKNQNICLCRCLMYVK